MAVVDQGRFYDTHGLNPVELGNALADWFRSQEFEWRTFGGSNERYTVQIRKTSTGRSIFGLNYALTVSFAPQPDGRTLVELGGSDWTDKIISGAVGALWITPLLFTAAFGAWKQSDLGNRVWDFLNGYIYNRTGQPANSVIAVPHYNGVPNYNPNTPPPPGVYYPSANYTSSVRNGFPPADARSSAGASRPTGPQDRSWFDPITMEPIFDQQIGRMASWQKAMADGKIVDEEVQEQKDKVEKLRRNVEERLDTNQKIKLAEVVAALEKLESAHLSLKS